MTDQMKIKPSRRTVVLIVLVLVALLSILVISKVVTAPAFSAATMESLDDKQDTVMKLAAAAAASSTALSLIPGDAAMPIANQIAELTAYFIVILGAILLEKMLITAVGYVSFTYIIPAACLLGCLYLFIRKEVLKNIAIKLAIFGIILFAAIPASIQASDLIYDSYQTSIKQTIVTAEQNKEYIEDTGNNISKEDLSVLEKAKYLWTSLTSKIGKNISAMVQKGEETLAALLESIAVLIITSCVIPIVVILIFAWAIKILFGFDIKGVSTIVRKKLSNRQTL